MACRRYVKKIISDYEQACNELAVNPTPEDTRIVVERLVQRPLESKQLPRFYGKTISKDEYIKMLSELL